MTRREFLLAAGPLVSGVVFGACASGVEAGVEDQVTPEKFKELKATADVALRNSMDIGVMFLQSIGYNINFEQFKEVMNKALESAKGGNDPLSADFWTKLDLTPEESSML